MKARTSKRKSCPGIIIWKPHFGQGVKHSGYTSPGMNTFAPQPPQVTIRNALPESPVALICDYTRTYCDWRQDQMLPVGEPRQMEHRILGKSCGFGVLHQLEIEKPLTPPPPLPRFAVCFLRKIGYFVVVTLI